MPPKKRGRPPKPKPLTQKAEKEMMGQEDIASANREADDIRAKAVARMAKAREAKAEKKKAVVVAPSKENITLKIDEAPYGYTASGRKRSKPLKEKPIKEPKPIKEKPIKAPKAPKAPKKTKVLQPIPPPPPLKKDLTPKEKEKQKQIKLRQKIHTLPEELRKYTREFVGKEKVNMIEVNITPLGNKDDNLEYFIEEYMESNDDEGWNASEWRTMIYNADDTWVLLDNKNGDVKDAVAKTLVDEEDEDYNPYGDNDEAINEDPQAYGFVRIGDESATGITPNILDLLQALEIDGLVKLKYKYATDLQRDNYNEITKVSISKKGEIDKPPPVRLNNRPIWALIKPHLKEAFGRGIYVEDRYDNNFYVSIGYIKEILESALEMGEPYDANDVYDNIRDSDKKDPYITDQVLQYLFYNQEEVPNLFEDPLFSYGEADDSEYRNESEPSSKASSRSSSGWETEGEGLEGGALSAKELKGLLGASYDPKIDKVGDFILDSKLSTSTSKVYHNPNSGQTVVAHKGTEGILDWGNNAVYALGGKTAYKMTPRYKEAEKVQKKAESKYGAKNVSTIGHSQGGLQSELLGGKSKEIITLNKATRPFESNKNKNQTDVRSSRDVVSALNPFEKKSSKNVEIQGETYNPLAEHSGDVLDRLDENQMIGEGIRRMVKGEGTEAQRFIANMLRSRFNPKELPPAPLAEARRSLATLYPNINGTVYTMENIQGALNALTHSADATGYNFDNPYIDYEERPTFISRPRLYGNPTIPPDILVDVALKSYFDMVYNLHRKGFLTGTKQKGQWVFGDEMKTIPKALQPQYETFLRDKANRIVPKFFAKTLPEAKASVEKAREAKRPEVLKKFVGKVERVKEMERYAWWVDLNNKNFEPLRRMFDDYFRFIKENKKEEFKKVEGEIANFKTRLLDEITQFKDNYGIKGALPKWLNPLQIQNIITPPPLGNWNNRNFIKFENPFPPLPKAQAPPKVEAQAPPKAEAFPKLGETRKMGGKETPAFKPKGSGLPIDFESMNWGSLTEQMKAYNSQHSKDLDLEGFARMIVADPKSFQKRTLQRARFYINVLLPKKK